LEYKTAPPYGNFIIWNNRKQKLQFRRGILLQEVWNQMKAFKSVNNRILRAFSMLGWNGEEMSNEEIINQIQKHFTPEFYPRRFEFKDFLYERVCVIN